MIIASKRCKRRSNEMKKLYELRFYKENYEPTCSMAEENGAFVLGYEDAKEIAKRASEDYGYIVEVVEVDFNELLKHNGIYGGDMERIEDLKIYNSNMTVFEYIIKVLKGE